MIKKIWLSNFEDDLGLALMWLMLSCIAGIVVTGIEVLLLDTLNIIKEQDMSKAFIFSSIGLLTILFGFIIPAYYKRSNNV